MKSAGLLLPVILILCVSQSVIGGRGNGRDGEETRKNKRERAIGQVKQTEQLVRFERQVEQQGKRQQGKEPERQRRRNRQSRANTRGRAAAGVKGNPNKPIVSNGRKQKSSGGAGNSGQKLKGLPPPPIRRPPPNRSTPFNRNLPDLTKLPSLNFDCSDPLRSTKAEKSFCKQFNNCLRRKARRNKGGRKGGKNNGGGNRRSKRDKESKVVGSGRTQDEKICHTQAHLQVVSQTIFTLPPTPPSI